MNTLNVLGSTESILKPAEGANDIGLALIAKDYPEIIGSIYKGPYYTNISYLVYDTELKIEPNEEDFYMLLYPRSSIINTNLILANSVGVIDPGYRGNLKVCFRYVIQPEDQKIIEGKSAYGKNAKGIVASINPQKIYHEGDKSAQLGPTKINRLTINKAQELSSSLRGEGGFGSTGK